MAAISRPQVIVERDGYRFPPGPRGDLMWRILRRRRPIQPLQFFQSLTREYGNIAHYRIRGGDVIFINDPEYIHQVLVVQNDKFMKERTMQRSKMLLGEGMLTAEGATHRAQRRAAQPAFQRQRIPSYASSMVELALRTRESWQSEASMDIAQEMMRLTLGIVGKTLFDTDLRQEAAEIAAAINAIMGMYNLMLIIPAADFLARLPLPGMGKFRRNRGRLDQAIYRMIAEHRAGRRSADDLLSMLLQAADVSHDDIDLRDQVMTLFLAGYETVSNTLTWTWYLLSQNPEIESRLHQELDTVLGGRLPNSEDYPKLCYTEMVLAESMRLYPAAWGMGRIALQEFELGPYRFPERTTVAMSQFIVHRNPEFYPDPLHFDPERFSTEAKAGRPRFSYFPFGGGGRQCIGESFAWMEGVLVLATIAQRWKLRLVDGHPVEPEPLISLRPKYGMLMQAQSRE